MAHSPHGNDQWKISHRANTTTQPSLSIGRSQSPFSRIDRYKPKSPIIKQDSPQHSHDHNEEEQFYTPDSTRQDAIVQQQTKVAPDVAIISQSHIPWTWWSGYAFFLTCCIPNWALSALGGKRTKLIQQAWREKIALCSVIILLCMCLGFLTFGMRFALCPHERETNTYSFYNQSTGQTELTWRTDINVYGRLYPFDTVNAFFATRYNMTLSRDFEGANLSPLFDADPDRLCSLYAVPSTEHCTVMNPYTPEPTAALNHSCISIHELTSWFNADRLLEFSWDDLKLQSKQPVVPNQPYLMVLSDTVIDIHAYLVANQSIFGDNVNMLLRQTAGQDATYIFSAWDDAKAAWPCISRMYAAGVISSDTMGCIAYEIVTDFFLALVVMLMLTRYSMALVFHWWVSRRLTLPGGRSRGIFAWRSIAGGNQFPKKHRPSNSSSQDTLVAENDLLLNAPKANKSDIFENDPRHTILFVTCYSEGRESIESTFNSLAATTYSNDHLLLFIVADGIITGSGNSRPTSEICRDLLTLVDCGPDEEEPAFEYEAIADGARRVNRARVYTGHYKSIPAILVVKCGTESEAHPGNSKPGNRGKRDSQMILMTFFQKVIFYDVFSPLDYEIFWKMKRLMKAGLSPDKFELVLMVDADTRVDPDSITHMVAAMNNDITLMGLCGETKVANKSASWVTAIQVFEYFISHHYAKAFESIFGGVTCLPGCFSMYRIKAPKHGGWIPILANPDIIQEFNVTTVNTLHAKNLLLLGEDRFLSTLMLRVFPRRQMIFVPQATCRTIVPDSFAVLLSQRRRWINSTVHNLMELALVSDLCGIACLSMQFVVVIDLISSIVLPAAILLLLAFFVNLGFTDSPQYQPLFILLATLGLPALLILFTAKKVSYIGWMAIYILALPIWNFVLPIYSFWHFDDFSWGETRKVNELNTTHVLTKDEKPTAATDNLTVEKKLWHVWEQERLKSPANRPQKIKRSLPNPSPTLAYRVTTVSPQAVTSTPTIYPLMYQHPMYYHINPRPQHQQQQLYRNNMHLMPPQPRPQSITMYHQNHHPMPMYQQPQQLSQNSHLQYDMNRRFSTSFY
ncbi:glycosyltransferase family 2 protein [Mucor ambiguus]|uniref:chitin synthase n=1 Tax=Mucor ambiguus TaxID=91626 RepID=A0A0C9MMJ2_9FUNG|nr:glycosyltransferase family 2 protein [Mucor ambiguus]